MEGAGDKPNLDWVAKLSEYKDAAWVAAIALTVVYALGWLSRYLAYEFFFGVSPPDQKEASFAAGWAGIVFLSFVFFPAYSRNIPDKTVRHRAALVFVVLFLMVGGCSYAAYQAAPSQRLAACTFCTLLMCVVAFITPIVGRSDRVSDKLFHWMTMPMLLGLAVLMYSCGWLPMLIPEFGGIDKAVWTVVFKDKSRASIEGYLVKSESGIVYVAVAKDGKDPYILDHNYKMVGVQSGDIESLTGKDREPTWKK